LYLSKLDHQAQSTS